MLIEVPPQEPPTDLWNDGFEDDPDEPSSKMPKEIVCWQVVPYEDEHAHHPMVWKRSGFGYTNKECAIPGSAGMKIMLN